MPFDDSMKAAIRHCIDNGILKPFLETNSSEVQNMLESGKLLEDITREYRRGEVVSG